mgnify:FL=1
MSLKSEAIKRFLIAARSLANQGLSKEAIMQFAKNEFGEVTELFKRQIDNIFKKPATGIEKIKVKDEVFDDTVIKLPVDDTGKPFNPRDPLKQYDKPKKFRLNKERFQKDFNVSDDEIEEILKMSSEEQRDVVNKYINKDFRERIELSDYDVTNLKPNAEGGIVGYYTGGLVDVEPSLSDIGHGSDALMARTRLLSPGSQGTTSTGLNYLLAEDNDNIRIPFSKGKVVDKARRKFMKYAGTGIGGIAALKAGLINLAQDAAPKIEAVKETVVQAPNYFFDLANTIKMFGKKSKQQISERIDEYSMKSQDGKSELILIEDVGTGETQIKKIGKENDEMITEVQTMEYSPGLARADEAGVPADDYQEFTEYNSRIYKDEYNEPMIEEGIKVEDITKEIIKDKKASGGVANLLGE